MSKNLSDCLELWGIEENSLLFTDGSIGFGLEIKQLCIDSSSDETINSVSSQVRGLLNSLPPNLDIQFITEVNKKNSEKIQNFSKISNSVENQLALNLKTEKASSFEQLELLGLIPNHKLYLFVRKKFDSNLSNSRFLLKKSKALEISEEILKKEIKSAKRIKCDLLNELSQIGAKPEELSSNKILDLVYWQWNPGRQIHLGRVNPENVRDHLLFSDVLIDQKGFTINSTHHRVLSLKNLPEQTLSAMSRVLCQLPVGSKSFLSIHVPDQNKELESLQTQRRITHSMVMGQNNGMTDLESSAKYQDLENLLDQMIANGEKVFHVSLNILLSSEDLDDLDDQVAQALSLFREMAGSEGLVETYATFDIFKQFSLPNARCSERSKRLRTSNLADFVPLYAPWKGHDRPNLLLRGCSGNLLAFNPFDNSHSNANQLVSAGSGAGKSFFVNLFILQMLKEGPSVFFVDIGGSYQKLCENLSGQFIPFGVDSGISINPFDLPEGERLPSHHKIKFLVGLVELMTREENEQHLPRLTRSMLEEAILRVYRTVEKPRLSDLRAVLLKSDSKKLKEVGEILSAWCGDSAFGEFIDKPTNIQMENKLIAFDLKGLESFEELQTVCLYLITDLIWQNIQKDRYQMKFVVFDECWKLLKDKAGQQFIESIFRTCRKYYTSCIAISQAIQDFTESKISSAIIPNCSIKWLLKQGQSDPASIQKYLGLNENEVHLVNNLCQRKGHFSEAYLMSGQNNRSVVSIEPTPLELWIATTNPKDLKQIEVFKSKNKNLSSLEILTKLSNKYPNGYEGS